MNRRGFIARLFAAPIVALALLKAPIDRDEPQFGDGFDEDEIRSYIEPAVKAVWDEMDAAAMKYCYVVPR